MDAFYASVEQREQPRLCGHPLAVGFDGPRGVVTTANYEARRYGIHSAMPMAKARQLCPQLNIVPCRFPLYKEVSAQIHTIFREYTDLVEPISLDEAFLDVTVNKPDMALACEIAVEIKRKILERTSLTASAGISYNKFLAKIASDYHKPDGLFVVHPKRALDFIAGLPVEDFWGVGPKTAEKMHRLGIFTGEHLRQQPLGALIAHFGKAGRTYYDFARGIDERPVRPERVRKSVGCEETFLNDIYMPEDIDMQIDALADSLTGRLERHSFEGRTLTLKVKFHDFTQITRSVTKEHPIDERDDIARLARFLLHDVDYSRDHAIRLLGLSISHPVLAEGGCDRSGQPTLFDLFPDEMM